MVKDLFLVTMARNITGCVYLYVFTVVSRMYLFELNYVFFLLILSPKFSFLYSHRLLVV